MAFLKQRSPGSWQVRVYGGYKPDGSQNVLVRTIHTDPKASEKSQRVAAEREAAKIEADFLRHLTSSEKKISIKDLFEDYISDRCERKGLSPRTVADYKKLFNSRIVPRIGKTAIQDLTAREVNAFLRSLEKEDPPLSGTYRRKYFQQLHELCVYAQRMGYITMNPCDLVESPKIDTQEAQYYETDECGRILDALDSFSDVKWRLYFVLAIYSGMRPCEMTGLNWSDYDGKTVSVSASAIQLKGEKCRRADKPKTKKSLRKIDLPSNVTDLFKLWRIRQAEYRLRFGDAWPDPDAIFTNDEGYRISLTAASRRWKQFTTENKLPHLKLYSLRHTNASLMISENLNVRDVSARLGHAQASTTLNIYAHSFRQANKRATSAVVRAIRKCR